VDARRYEIGTEKECALNFVQDMQERFSLLKPDPEDQTTMNQLLIRQDDANFDISRRQCSGLVLKAMGFLENGI